MRDDEIRAILFGGTADLEVEIRNAVQKSFDAACELGYAQAVFDLTQSPKAKKRLEAAKNEEVDAYDWLRQLAEALVRGSQH